MLRSAKIRIYIYVYLHMYMCFSPPHISLCVYLYVHMDVRMYIASDA